MFHSHDSRRRAIVFSTVVAAVSAPLALSAPSVAHALPTGPCPSTACVSVGNASIVEGDAGTRTMTFPVTLSQPATATVSMKYRLQDLTATGGAAFGAGIDFIDKASALQTLTFARGASGFTSVTRTVSVKIAGDALVEGTETLRLTLSALSGPARFRRAIALGTIVDDDLGSGVRAGIGDAAVVEGDLGRTRNLSFPVTLSGPSSSPITLTYAVTPGSATYSATPAGGAISGSWPA